MAKPPPRPFGVFFIGPRSPRPRQGPRQPERGRAKSPAETGLPSGDACPSCGSWRGRLAQYMPPKVSAPPTMRASVKTSSNSQIPQMIVSIGEPLLKVATWLASNRERARFWNAHPNGVIISDSTAKASQAVVETWPNAGQAGPTKSATGIESKQPSKKVPASAGMAPCRWTNGLLTAM